MTDPAQRAESVKISNVNIINFAKRDQGVGVKRISTKSGWFAVFVIICLCD